MTGIGVDDEEEETYVDESKVTPIVRRKRSLILKTKLSRIIELKRKVSKILMMRLKKPEI